jgi:hypothetical protein
MPENLLETPSMPLGYSAYPRGNVLRRIQNLLVWGLFNDAISSSDEKMPNDKNMEGNGGGLI